MILGLADGVRRTKAISRRVPGGPQWTVGTPAHRGRTLRISAGASAEDRTPAIPASRRRSSMSRVLAASAFIAKTCSGKAASVHSITSRRHCRWDRGFRTCHYIPQRPISLDHELGLAHADRATDLARQAQRIPGWPSRRDRLRGRPASQQTVIKGNQCRPCPDAPMSYGDHRHAGATAPPSWGGWHAHQCW
jgi:hypothetical protein